MKITIQDCESSEEEEIIIKCHSVDEQLLKMIYAIKNGRDKITVYKEDKFFRISPKDIYYFEAVDNKVFAYMEKEVYETKYRLYELEEKFANTDFFRATKSTIINLIHVKNFAPSLGGRYEAYMKNSEKLIISRQYVADLKSKLGIKN